MFQLSICRFLDAPVCTTAKIAIDTAIRQVEMAAMVGSI